MSDIIELQTGLHLPEGSACMTWSADAGRAVPVGPAAWKAIQRMAAAALQTVYASTPGVAAVVWMWERPWRTKSNRPSSLVTLFVGTDAALDRDAVDQVAVAVETSGMGWHNDGVHPRPSDAFPVLGIFHGELTQIWQQDADGPYTLSLRRNGASVQRHKIRLNDVRRGTFLPRVRHAIGDVDGLRAGDDARRRRFELAFSLRVARRIVEADGVIESDEASFLRQSFPRELLAAHRLSDPPVLEEVADMAERQLKDLLGHHEKLALLNVFYATCCADGRVDVREVKALKQAAETLGLAHEDVVAYLAKLW